jgi:phosphoglycerate dehydrogenase-like enzyme
MADVVVDLKDRRPIWAIPEWAIERIRAALPDGWTLHAASSHADGSGDGRSMGPSDEVREALRGARVYLGYGVTPGVLEAGRHSLRWVHSGAAGVGGSIHPAMREAVGERGVVFTNSAGIHGPPIAETAVAMVLYFARGLDLAVRAQAEGRWGSRAFFAEDAPVFEVAGSTVGIVGFGGIGREVGRRFRALGARVVGVRRTAPAVGDPPDPEGFEVLGGFGADGLERLLGLADVVVVATPETEETRGMLNEARLRSCRPGAVIVNVARGAIIDEGALVGALESGHLRGAGLDVFQVEPLPPESPLWSMPNVLITPHVSGVSRRFWDRETDLVLENLRRLLAGEPLRNQVSLDAGY